MQPKRSERRCKVTGTIVRGENAAWKFTLMYEVYLIWWFYYRLNDDLTILHSQLMCVYWPPHVPIQTPVGNVKWPCVITRLDGLFHLGLPSDLVICDSRRECDVADIVIETDCIFPLSVGSYFNPVSLSVLLSRLNIVTSCSAGCSLWWKQILDENCMYPCCRSSGLYAERKR